MQSDIRREIALALRQAVRAPIAFCFAASHASEVHLDGLEVSSSGFAELPAQSLDALAVAFQFPDALTAAGTRYCVPGGTLAASVFGALNPLRTSGRNAAVLYLHAGGALHGMAGLIRYEDDVPFDHAELQHLEQIGPVLSSLTRLHSNVVRLQRPSTPPEGVAAVTPPDGTPAARPSFARTPVGGVPAVGRSPAISLSEREQQVARLLADGSSCVNTAAVLNLSENTVRTYVRRLYRKLAVTNRVDLVQRLAVSTSTT